MKARTPKWVLSVWRDPVGSKLIAGGLGALVLYASSVVPPVRGWVTVQLYGISRLQVIGWFAFGTALGASLTATLLRRKKLATSISTPTAAPSGASPSPPSTANASPSSAPTLTTPAVEPFSPIPVLDERHELEWHINIDPAVWLARTPALVHVDDILDGPFHSAPFCMQRLKSKYLAHGHNTVLDPVCPKCRVQLFAGALPDHDKAKKDVIEELRRLDRQGKKVSRPTVLEHADYWNGIRPKSATR